jgi:hypothetical protein
MSRMDALLVMSVFMVSGAVGVAVAWATMSLLFLFLRRPPVMQPSEHPAHR